MRRTAKTEQIQIRATRTEKRTLERRARAAGLDLSSWVLGRLNPPRRAQFQKLVGSLGTARDRAYALSEIGGLLGGLGRDEFLAVTDALPPVSLDGVASNQLAAMVELRAARLGVHPPTWTDAIPPLRVPWFATELVSVRLHLLCNAPPAYRRRNLFVDATYEKRR